MKPSKNSLPAGKNRGNSPIRIEFVAKSHFSSNTYEIEPSTNRHTGRGIAGENQPERHSPAQFPVTTDNHFAAQSTPQFRCEHGEAECSQAEPGRRLFGTISV